MSSATAFGNFLHLCNALTHSVSERCSNLYWSCWKWLGLYLVLVCTTVSSKVDNLHDFQKSAYNTCNYNESYNYTVLHNERQTNKQTHTNHVTLSRLVYVLAFCLWPNLLPIYLICDSLLQYVCLVCEYREDWYIIVIILYNNR